MVSTDIKKAEEGPKFRSAPAAMSTNEATNEVRQAAIEDATTDKLEVSVVSFRLGTPQLTRRRR
jgi:hypothetical protein